MFIVCKMLISSSVPLGAECRQDCAPTERKFIPASCSINIRPLRGPKLEIPVSRTSTVDLAPLIYQTFGASLDRIFPASRSLLQFGHVRAHSFAQRFQVVS